MRNVTLGYDTVPTRFAILFSLLGIRHKYSLPETWNELSRKQLLHVSNLIFSKSRFYVTAMKITKHLSQIPFIAFNWISDQDKVFLAKQFPWLIDFDQKLIPVNKIALTDQLIPEYRNYYGPAKNFDDLTVDEFHFADKLFIRYLQTRKPDDLNLFVSVLYRRKIHGHRVHFNNKTIEIRAARIAGWSSKVKLAIFLWYYGCKNEFIKNNPDLFPPSAESHPLGFYAVISNLSPKFGTIESTRKTRLKDFALEWKKAVHDAKPKPK